MFRGRDAGAFSHCPTGAISWMGFIWLTFGFGLLFIMGIAVSIAAHTVTVPSRQVYSGVLRPGVDDMQVTLPAGLPLGNILVSRGETVVAGQTLVTLDRDMIAEQLRQTERIILGGQIERECLLHDTRQKTMPSQLGDNKEATQVLEIAIRRCIDILETSDLARGRIAAEQKAILHRVTTLDQQRRLLFETEPETAAQKLRKANAAVALAVKENDLEARLAVLELDAHALVLELEQKILSRIEIISEDIESGLQRRVLLRHYLEAPRLTAPEDGTIIRTRPMPVGTAASEPTGIIDIRNEQSRMYLASFVAPRTRSTYLQRGLPVSLSMATMDQNTPELKGYISGHQASTAGLLNDTVDVTVELDAASTDHLSNPASGIALRGENTFSRISVAMPDIILSQVFADWWQSKCTAAPIFCVVQDAAAPPN